MKNLINKINIDHLTDMISQPRGWWAWCKQDGKHWITNRHFVLILDQKGLEDEMEGWELLECLEQKFEKQTPLEGKQLVNNQDFVSEVLGKNGETIADSLKRTILLKPSNNVGTVTPLIYAKKDFRNRWLKFPDFNLFVQDEYISVLYDAVDEPVCADAFNKPIFLCDGQFVILPVIEMEDDRFARNLKIFGEMPEVLAEVTHVK